MHHLPRLLAVLAFAGSAVPALAASPSPEDLRFFEAKIRPLLAENCFKCHGPQKQRGDLRLDSAEAFAKGGDSGNPLLDAKAPDESLFLRAIRHADGVEKMPPDRKLKESEIADLTAWLKRGAPFPPSAKSADADRTKHWTFQPMVKHPVPRVKNRTWAKTDLDRFVLSKLEAAGLKPPPLADKRTLIRRATYDLTGLPPTPEEIDAFLKDESPTAFAKVIDRLLASPAYGEHWGRHWLDVARYADSNGLDENVAHGNAWRYRDYVIASLNADKPYDRFLIEQIAGDLLPAATTEAKHEQLIATGFLVLGPKVLAEPDEKKMELDIVDEQLDTLGRTVMGLTLGCARCHDHKFDPVTAADYYGLAGVLVSTKTMDSFKSVARWHENPLETPETKKKVAEYEAAKAKLQKQIDTLKGKTDDKSKAEVKKLDAELKKLTKAGPDVPSAMGVTEGKATDLHILRRGNHLTPAGLVPRRFPEVLAGKQQPPLPADHSGRLELAKWLTNPKHPLTARVMVNRVWRWHFGKGLVRSVDNFGLLGDKPSHPELLDWLAMEFTRDGWSLKKFHRKLMLSSTYGMGSVHDEKAALADPDNQLLWKATPKRLEAEMIRDSFLAVGGLLDRTAGGPALKGLKNRDYIFNHTSKDNTTYASSCRSVYLPVIRNNLYDVFQLFDAPDGAVASGDRATTTVPTQALFFLNSDLAARSADGLAGRVLEQPPEKRVSFLYATAYGREPSAAEIDQVSTGLAEFESAFATETNTTLRTRKAWAGVCQALLASNEFVLIP